MPKDAINYSFTENSVVYDFYDVFVPAEIFRQPALWTWGNNAYGSIGDGTTTTKITPVTTILGGTNWKSVDMGYGYSSAIKTDGTLWCWGGNTSFNFGQNGINVTGTAGRRTTPVTTFAGGNDWKQISSGYAHKLAIKTDGTLWVWGHNNLGQLGTNDTTDRLTPVTTFAGGTNWKKVSGGGSDISSAIKTDGTLWVWGVNSSNQLGINATGNRTTPVTTFSGGINWKEVSNSKAIKSDGTLWVWGINDVGQLGTNDLTSRSTPVTTFAGGTNWNELSSSDEITAAIKTDGTLWIWGNNNRAQLGINNTANRSTPVTTFAGGTNWKSVFCAGYEVAAIKTDGTLWTWGRNLTGQLGINASGATTNRSTPVTTFAGGNNWKLCSLGGSTIAIQYKPDP